MVFVSDPLKPSSPTGDSIGTTEVTIAFVSKQTLSFIKVIAVPLKEGQNPGKSSDGKYDEVTLNYDNQEEGKPYVSAEFANEKLTRINFLLEMGTFKYLNGELSDGTKYAVFQRSFDENAGIFYYRRRQSSPRNGEDEELNMKPRKRIRTLTDRIRGRGSGAFGEAIPVEEFEDHARRLHANGDLLFSQEYSALRPSSDFTWNATLAQENRYKNRYNNIVAYDHSRVHLTPIQEKKAYIATQGPLPETVDDFWRMVWEQGTKTIVMVTNVEERGRVKCHQYWPTKGGEAYGDIQVTLTQTVELSDFTVRTLCLKKANSRSERTLNQYHYTIWPDHGVPTCATSVLTFVRKASGANPPDAGPMVVHCSAGVGRTGTFVVVDAMLQRIAAEKSVDVFGFVMSLRRDRNIMVQVEEQYVFIHDVLLEAIHSGYTEIRASDLRSHIKNLMQVNSASGQTEMDEEFIRLGRGSTAPQSKFQNANMAYNKTKNRYANVLAFDDTRVKLGVITGIEGSDYINANFVDGYMMRRAFIATQAPIPDTIPDFWRMIWEQESSTVVMLSKETESGKVKVHRYWPAKHPANIGTLVVEMTNEMVYDDYTMREIKLTNTKETASRVIRQYHYTGWPDVGSPDSGTGLIDLIGQVQRWQQQSGQYHYHCTLQCPFFVSFWALGASTASNLASEQVPRWRKRRDAGVGRTGVFCALSILIERLKSEGVVDVFQTVKQLRSQRPAMVQTKDQYEFIYSALSEYLDSFDAYSNFE
ncbi:hypothetical protein OS493_038944 [Desmophyllum pertusum]|uniref:Uncharacterized protein n=1 Tax=Desmophyllum pertusum TaxID=174260 RepID=A0A9W9YXA7_9CNID|nr:hypothetical protein OS493_038944 [Desmophyllum pertusum]